MTGRVYKRAVGERKEGKIQRTAQVIFASGISASMILLSPLSLVSSAPNLGAGELMRTTV